MTSSYRAIDLFEKVRSAESALVTVRADDIINLAVWTRLHVIEVGDGVGFLDWLYEEARKYEMSVDDGSAAEG